MKTESKPSINNGYIFIKVWVLSFRQGRDQKFWTCFWGQIWLRKKESIWVLMCQRILTRYAACRLVVDTDWLLNSCCSYFPQPLTRDMLTNVKQANSDINIPGERKTYFWAHSPFCGVKCIEMFWGFVKFLLSKDCSERIIVWSTGVNNLCSHEKPVYRAIVGIFKRPIYLYFRKLGCGGWIKDEPHCVTRQHVVPPFSLSLKKIKKIIVAWTKARRGIFHGCI